MPHKSREVGKETNKNNVSRSSSSSSGSDTSSGSSSSGTSSNSSNSSGNQTKNRNLKAAQKQPIQQQQPSTQAEKIPIKRTSLSPPMQKPTESKRMNRSASPAAPVKPKLQETDLKVRENGSKSRERRSSKKRSSGRRKSNSPRRKKPRSPSPKTSKVHIGHLTRNVTRDHVLEIFAVYGPIRSVEMIPDKCHPEFSRGFAYIEYETPEDMLKAVKHMDGAQIDGQEVSAAPILLPKPASRLPVKSPPRRTRRRPSPPRPRRSPPRETRNRERERERERGRRRSSPAPQLPVKKNKSRSPKKKKVPTATLR